MHPSSDPIIEPSSKQMKMLAWCALAIFLAAFLLLGYGAAEKLRLGDHLQAIRVETQARKLPPSDLMRGRLMAIARGLRDGSRRYRFAAPASSVPAAGGGSAPRRQKPGAKAGPFR